MRATWKLFNKRSKSKKYEKVTGEIFSLKLMGKRRDTESIKVDREDEIEIIFFLICEIREKAEGT